MAVPTAVQRRTLAKLGCAMPDGSYYIRAGQVGASDLKNAIDTVGRGQEDSHNAIRRHIAKRAKALGLSDNIPVDWQSDGTLMHSDTDSFLEHFGLVGMRWGHHLPGVEVLGGPGNGDGGGSAKPSPFIQRGDHTNGKSGDSGPSGKDDTPPDQHAKESLDALGILRQRAADQAESARAEDENADHVPEKAPGQSSSQTPSQSSNSPAASSPHQVKTTAKPPAVKQAPVKPSIKTGESSGSHKTVKPKSKLRKSQASAVHQAAKKHLGNISQIHNKAKALHDANKKHVAMLARHHNKAEAKRKINAANRLHAAHLAHLKKVALLAHAAHLKHVADLKRPSHLTAKQKDAQHKAALASAKKRHEAAILKKSGVTAAANRQTAAAQARRTPAQRAAYDKLATNAQNHVLQLSMDDVVDTFLEHHGVKGMHWGVRRSQVRSGISAGNRKAAKAGHQVSVGLTKTAKYAASHPGKATGIVYGAWLASKVAKSAYNNREEIAGTAKILAHIIKVMNARRKSPAGQETLALGRAFIQGHVIHGEDPALDEYFEHFGVKGMHWGVRKDHSERIKELRDKADEHDRKSVEHVKVASSYAKQHQELLEKGFHSEAAKRVYGSDAASKGEWAFYGQNGMGKAQALNDLSNNLRSIHNHHVRAANRNSAAGVRLRAKADKLQHDDIDETSEFLEHFGIKGQKWGVRRNGGHPGSYAAKVPTDSSPDHQQAALIKAKIKTHKGIHALSNEELESLSRRLNLEANYHRMNPHTGKLEKGRKFVKGATSDVKTVIDAVNTGQRAVKTAQGFGGFSNPHFAGRRHDKNQQYQYHPQFKLAPVS